MLPEWSLAPKNLREVADESGLPPYELVSVTERGVVPPEHIHFVASGEELVLPPNVLEKKEALIEARKKDLASRFEAAMRRWEDGGRQGEAPRETLFHDASLLRVLPKDIVLSGEADGPHLHIQTGHTTYFDYVATRDLRGHPLEQLAMPLACCGAMKIRDVKGREYALFSERTERGESYPGYYHAIGGMIATDDPAGSPGDWWQEEVREETGIEPGEIDVHGSFGVAVDTCWPHPELLYFATVRARLEEVFERGDDPHDLFPKRTTDKEVHLKAVPLNSTFFHDLLTASRSPGGPAPRPWVPTGLANMQLAGREWFGKEWRQHAVEEYRHRLQALLRSSAE